MVSRSRAEKRAQKTRKRRDMAPVKGLELHPDAHLIPETSDEQYQKILASVRRFGVRKALDLEPNTSTILDGRTRWRAAKEAGLTHVPVVEAELKGESPTLYMLRMAIEHRHLSASQLAAVGLEFKKQFEGPARERMELGTGPNGSGGRGKKKNPPANLREGLRGKGKGKSKANESAQLAADKSGASARNIQYLEAVEEKAPELIDKVKSGEMTVHQAKVEVQRREKRAELEALADAQRVEGQPPWEIYTGDCLDLFTTESWKLEGKRPHLIFADPPYNIGVDYGNGADADKKNPADFVKWCAKWIAFCEAALSPDGSMWLLISDEFALEVGLEFKRAFQIQNWVIWYESFGVNCSKGFNRTKRHLFHGVKSSRFTFNEDAVSRPSDRQTKYNDARANPGGKLLDDVWFDIPRMTGNAAERIPDFPTQLPLALVSRVVACASRPGDLVLDPFCGSGTTGAAALSQCRPFVGFEQSADYARLAELRLKGVEPCQ